MDSLLNSNKYVINCFNNERLSAKLSNILLSFLFLINFIIFGLKLKYEKNMLKIYLIFMDNQILYRQKFNTSFCPQIHPCLRRVYDKMDYYFPSSVEGKLNCLNLNVAHLKKTNLLAKIVN